MKATIAFLGLAGWYESGRSGEHSTFTRTGGLQEHELTADIRVDLRPILIGAKNPVAEIWNRPNLNLSLPDDNVRSLFEGCIGYDGTIEGHPWDGAIETLHPSDSVGLNVYLAVLKNQGAVIEGI